MEYNQRMISKWEILELILKGWVCIWLLTMMIHVATKADFDQELAREYGVPMGEFIGEYPENCYFPIPHTKYYIVTEMGKEYHLATDYFGFISFNDQNIKKFCNPEIYEEYNNFLKERDSE